MPQPRSRIVRWVGKVAVAALLTAALTVCAAVAAAEDGATAAPACAAVGDPEVPVSAQELADSMAAFGPGATRAASAGAGRPGPDICAGRTPTGSAMLPDVVGMGLGVVLPAFRLAPKTMALFIVPPHQFPAFDNIITRESGWNTFAINPESGAYGLGQALPAYKMSTHGPDWCCNPVTQLRWTYDYMNQRYGSPDGAWAFWQSHGWY
ncbi:lytic transglycosylase domain-containing protein [Nocardia blacklockiae]|uniref:aggregation-promoting factor C-terminal-like domain-containing protein n=1 Tax=Nocardia blacklockiae TaxID=480036 RepID=UPI00189328CB|nr:lytic transglycosylase domain-containing protein [Nocardia blacklockiae]MBF6171829.1 lytic transglycosylase domain-containing protein [Nocardia blacklockiae]